MSKSQDNSVVEPSARDAGRPSRPPSHFDLEGAKAVQGAADQTTGDRGRRIVAASIIIAVVSIVAVATTAVTVATAVTTPTGKVTSAVTTAGVTTHRMSTHRVTSHGMTAMPSAAVTASMSGRQGTRYRHATKGDCGSESNQCATKHLTLPL
jgi:hypothetical protein